MIHPFNLPKPIETYIQSVNAGDTAAFRSCFLAEAAVKDISREICGIEAISEWAKSDIFSVRVMMEVVDASDYKGCIHVSLKIDGDFDHTGLPNPLIMDHFFTLSGNQIASLECQIGSPVEAC